MIVKLRIFKNKENPKKGFMSVNGVDYSLEINNGEFLLKEIRTGAILYRGEVPATWPAEEGKSPVSIVLFSERTHPVFALYNIEAAHQIVFVKYSNPNPEDWIVVVEQFDIGQVPSQLKKE